MIDLLEVLNILIAEFRHIFFQGLQFSIEILYFCLVLVTFLALSVFFMQNPEIFEVIFLELMSFIGLIFDERVNAVLYLTYH